MGESISIYHFTFLLDYIEKIIISKDFTRLFDFCKRLKNTHPHQPNPVQRKRSGGFGFGEGCGGGDMEKIGGNEIFEYNTRNLILI